MAELEPALAGPYTDISFKLREETSKIVGCVAELCEELAVRRRKPRPDDVKAVSSVLGAPVDDLQDEQDAGDSGESGANRRSETGQVKAPLGLDGDVKLEGEGLQVVEVTTCMGEEASVEEAGLDESCLSQRKEEPGSCSGSLIGENGEDADEKLFRLTALELPDVSVDSVGLGYSAVKRDAEEWLGRVVAWTPSTKLDVPELWSFWKPESDVFEENYASEPGRELESRELQLQLSGPRRMQCDWCETFKQTGDFLYDESSRFLKKMVRANAQVFRLKGTAVPDVFEGDWGRALNDSHRPVASSGEELQQIWLPFDLVREDDAKVNDAPSKLVSLADSYSRTLQRSNVSLTNASMHIPSVWNLGVAAKRLANLVAEELKTGETQQESSASASCNSVPLPAQLVKVTSERGDHLEDKSTSSPRQSPTRNNEDNPLSTDYFLSDKFLRCDWSEPPDEMKPSFDSREDTNSSGSTRPLKFEHLLQQIARPALWDLMRKKLLQVDGPSFQSAFNHINLETLEAIIYQQFRDVKKMSLNPSAFSNIEIVEACSSLRQAAWLHTLRVVSISQKAAAQNAEMMPAVVARIVPSAKYKLIMGASNWKDFQVLLEAIGGCAVPSVDEAISCEQEEDLAFQQPQKRRRLIRTEKETTPVRVLCSIEFLEQDELLDELCTEQQVFFVERHLPAPVDMLVDERTCICVVEGATLHVDPNLRSFIFSLARLQVQLQKCWIIIVLDGSLSNELENAMNAFFAALVQFRIEIQVLTSFSCEETGRFVRAIIDECAEVALNCHRILPRLWYERPFLLEEESQFERFLVSTRVVNNFAAQSLLHKISIKDLFSKSIEELKLLVQNAVTEEQLQLLWGLLQQDHGLNGVLP